MLHVGLLYTLVHFVLKGHYQVSFNSNNKIECCCNKRVPTTSLQGPAPNTSGTAWPRPRRHPKGTTGVKINLAASPLGPAAEREKTERERRRERKRERRRDREKGGRASV